jgi:hypothetical protein
VATNGHYSFVRDVGGKRRSLAVAALGSVHQPVLVIGVQAPSMSGTA